MGTAYEELFIYFPYVRQSFFSNSACPNDVQGNYRYENAFKQGLGGPHFSH